MSPSTSATEPGALKVFDAITEKNQENSPFLRLPAEVRNQIHAYVCDTMTVDGAPGGYKYMRSGASIRLVCRQMKEEATKIAEQYFIVHFLDKIDDIRALHLLLRKDAILEIEMHQDLLENIVEIWGIGIECEACGPLKIKAFSNLRRVKVHDWVQCEADCEDRSVLRDVFCNENLDVVLA